jgi:hypothetical protein
MWGIELQSASLTPSHIAMVPLTMASLGVGPRSKRHVTPLL